MLLLFKAGCRTRKSKRRSGGEMRDGGRGEPKLEIQGHFFLRFFITRSKRKVLPTRKTKDRTKVFWTFQSWR